MSIYSGFATRFLETQYNLGICKLLHLCQSNLLSLLKNGKNYTESIDISNLTKSFTKLFTTLRTMETQKYLEPKITNFCLEFAVYVGCNDGPPKTHEKSRSKKNLDMVLIDDMLELTADKKEEISEKPYKIIARSHSTRQTKISARRDSGAIWCQTRPTSSKSTKNPRVATPSKRYFFTDKAKKRPTLHPAQLYQKQAMSLIYSNLEKN